MTVQKTHPLFGETLITLAEAAQDFGGVSIPLCTVQKYVYRGIRGIKLESIHINGRYTSKEAILRFIERKQNPWEKLEAPKVKMAQTEVDAALRRHGIIK